MVFGRRGRRKLKIFDPHTETMTTVSLSAIKQSYSGLAILIKPDIRLSAREPEAIQLARGHWFWGVVWRLWPSYMQVILAASIINILALASPLFIMNVYDRVLPNKAISTLWVLAVGMGLAIGFDLIFKLLRSWMIDAAGRRADVLLAGRIYEHVARTGSLNIEHQRSSQVCTNRETPMNFVLQPWQLFLLIIANWSNREQQQRIDYLETQYAVLMKQFGKRRILLTDDQRRRLAVKGKILGRKTLSEIGTLFTPDTILRWHRQLVANK